jgi:predicted Fe-Mo cluster-binding NifX family protein
MKIAVTAKGQDLGSEVDPRFGRAQYFVIIETETGKVDAAENSAAAASGGAGVAAAQLVIDRGASLVITGNCGPNAFRVLEAAGIGVVVGVEGTVGEAVNRFRSGELTTTGGANVRGHWGTGGESGRPGRADN